MTKKTQRFSRVMLVFNNSDDMENERYITQAMALMLNKTPLNENAI